MSSSVTPKYINPCHKPFIDFINLEASVGIILVVTIILTLVISNSPLEHFYSALLHTHIPIHSLNTEIKPLEFWINDGLMTIFFFVLGLELKREVLETKPPYFSQIILPIIAAIGGMLVPALVYVAVNWNSSATLIGWAIPSATDIGISLGILVLLGKRIPFSLKVFLLTVAIIDDLWVTIIIALYAKELNLFYLTFAVLLLAVPAIANFMGVVKLKFYLIIGLILWFLVLKAGLHATLAGDFLAFFIPNLKNKQGYNVLHHLEETLHPWVVYGVLPIFLFANAGIVFGGMTLNVLWEPIPLGIMLGLFLGKPLGILGFSWLAIWLGIAQMPKETNWLMLCGIAIIGGVGFTMSLFMGTLAFTDAESINQVRLGALLGSLTSAVVGYLVLLYATTKATNLP